MALVEVDCLSKQFGLIQAVKSISFKIERGECLAFIGPNGAGKSTTMRMITGYLWPSSGEIRIDGAPFYSDAIAAKKRIGYLPESAPLYPNRTVYEFLSEMAELSGLFGKAKRTAIERAVALCQLQSVLNQPTETLSKGYRHRTCLAQALLNDPDILVLDEPTDGLDPNQKRDVREVIRQMGNDKAIIVSTHILEEVEAIAGRVILIDRGEIQFDGTPEQLLCKHPSHRIDAAFHALTRGDRA